MIVLKQVIHDVPTNSVEATWVERTTTPEQIIPERIVTPATVDEDGNEVPAVIEPEQIIPAFDTDVQIRCHSYADRQMQLFRDHAVIEGTPLTDYEALIAEVEANQKPIPPAPVIPYTELRAATYPPVADYLDAWVKNDNAALEKYRADCLAVKAKYPKP
jgi:hypothetical protein